MNGKCVHTGFAAVLAISAVLVFSPRVRAEEVLAGSVYDEGKEAEVVQAARRRLYPGGKDENDLKVQSQLPSVIRKMTPQSESGEAAAADD